MVIPYLRKNLPRPVNIIIRNVPGGQWNIGISKMYRSNPDGHTIGILNLPGNAVNQILGTASYDLTKITWLGNLTKVTYVSTASKKSNFTKLEDFQQAPMINTSVVSLSGTSGLLTLISAKKMGIAIKPIPHSGSTEAILSVMRGDLDWYQGPYGSLKKAIVDSQDLIPIWVYAKKRLKLLPNIPTVVELGYESLLNLALMYRAVGAPPGMSKDVAEIWRNAFWKATNDPEFQKRVIKANGQPAPMRSGEVASIANNALKELTQYKKLVLKYRK
jgi:tripartite-type tricarboxylate transporter receptor subunit TctC